MEKNAISLPSTRRPKKKLARRPPNLFDAFRHGACDILRPPGFNAALSFMPHAGFGAILAKQKNEPTNTGHDCGHRCRGHCIVTGAFWFRHGGQTISPFSTALI